MDLSDSLPSSYSCWYSMCSQLITVSFSTVIFIGDGDFTDELSKVTLIAVEVCEDALLLLRILMFLMRVKANNYLHREYS